MRTTTSIWAGRALAILALAAAVSAQEPRTPPAEQQPPPPPPAEQPTGDQPTFRAGINFVRVDVIVTDRQGNPITDLKQEDFEVAEDNKPQSVETFRLVKIDTMTPVETTGRSIRTREDEETAAADENSRIFVFFLDDYHVRLETSMVARQPLIDFVSKLGPNDLLAVMYPLTPIDSVVLTRNHASVMRALERFEGRRFRYEPRNAIEEKYALYPTVQVEQIRRQVSLSALEGLSVKLGSLREGRKAVVVLSEGYSGMPPPQKRDSMAGIPDLANPARNDPFAGDNLNEDRVQFMNNVTVERELQDVFNAANRNNTSLYTLDPRGLTTGDFDITDNISMRTSGNALRTTQDSLRTLAEQTDGRAIVNMNDLGKGLAQVVRDSSYYYLVGYNSSQAPQDGKFHEIKVRVKRPGAQVRARRGYWALTAEDAVRATAPEKPGPPAAVGKALATLAQPTGARFARTWIGTSRGEQGKTKVTFVWEPVAGTAATRRAEAQSVSLTAASPSGDLYFRGKVPDAGTTGAAAASRSGVVSFEAPPGPLQLHVAIADASNSPLDTEERELVVPDLTSPDLALSTPRVHLAHNAREFQQVAADPAAPPTPGREFRRTDRLLVRIDASAPAETTPTLTSRLLNRQGQKMSDVPVTAGSAPGAPFAIDLPLSSLPPGEYLLEISAAAEGQTAVSELVAFKLTS